MPKLPRALHPTEKAFTEQVLAAARLGGWLAFHDYATNVPHICPKCKQPLRIIRNPKGFTDLVLVKGRVLFRELKVKGGTLSPEQREWRDALQAAGADWDIWTPDDWDDINRTLLGVEPWPS